jgi:hypothetical protein
MLQRVESAGGLGISAQSLELGLGVAGHRRLPAGRGGLSRCSLGHDRPGRVPLGLGLTMATTGSGSGLDP